MTTETLPQQKQGTGVYGQPSSYLKYLPAIYSEDLFLGRFLNIFENILTPIDQTINQVDLYLDPRMTPEGLLTWLASWISLVLDEEWPVDKRRQLISAAVDLYRLRGTRRGLLEYLRIYTAAQPTITEHYGGIRLGGMSQLGLNTVIGQGSGHRFTVTLELQPDSAFDVRKVKAIIEAEKPAHTAYNLEIVNRGKSDAADDRTGDVAALW